MYLWDGNIIELMVFLIWFGLRLMWTIQMHLIVYLSTHILTLNIHKLTRRQFTTIVSPFIRHRIWHYQLFHNYCITVSPAVLTKSKKNWPRRSILIFLMKGCLSFWRGRCCIRCCGWNRLGGRVVHKTRCIWFCFPIRHRFRNLLLFWNCLDYSIWFSFIFEFLYVSWFLETWPVGT